MEANAFVFAESSKHATALRGGAGHRSFSQRQVLKLGDQEPGTPNLKWPGPGGEKGGTSECNEWGQQGRCSATGIPVNETQSSTRNSEKRTESTISKHCPLDHSGNVNLVISAASQGCCGRNRRCNSHL